METKDYIIVGQGLAGTLLGYFLQKAGKRILFVDDGHQTAASKVAAGIFNPITGRRFVKSWMVDTLFPFAKATYAQMETELGVQIFYPNTIIRTLMNHVEDNQWMMRSDIPENVDYISDYTGLGSYEGKVVVPYSQFVLKNAGRTDILQLITTLREKWQQESATLEESFDYDAVEISNETVEYQGIKANKIIFCEGYKARSNPFFSYLAYKPTKGEVLLVRIPNADFSEMLKHKLYIIPFGEDIYWVGATNDWNEINDIPTKESRRYLENRLASFLEIPFEVLEHQAAVRPTVKDRRPYLGLHPHHPELGMFNGLGTKGASLGPYWAQHMADFLVEGQPLDPLVNIERMAKDV